MSVAAKNNFPDYDPRHRLTGAVVLILLAIVLLPMLLSKKPDTEVSTAPPVVMEVTKEGKKIFVSRISSTAGIEADKHQPDDSRAEKAGSRKVPSESESDKSSSALFKPPSNTSKTSAKTAKSETGRKVAKPANSKTTSNSKKKTKSASKAVPAGNWILQVGVFSQSVNASKKVAELKKKGFQAKSGKVKTSKGTVTKVWVGPFKDRKSAEKMQERLQHKTRQRGIVVKK